MHLNYKTLVWRHLNLKALVCRHLNLKRSSVKTPELHKFSKFKSKTKIHQKKSRFNFVNRKSDHKTWRVMLCHDHFHYFSTLFTCYWFLYILILLYFLYVYLYLRKKKRNEKIFMQHGSNFFSFFLRWN